MIALGEGDRARLVALRRALHAAPELSWQEHDTAARVEAELHSLGFSTERCLDTGVTALLDSGAPGPTVMLRADLDALPILEANDHAYVSQRPGVMHACGHDGHLAILVEVARQLRAAPPPRGKVLFVFQPAEEGAGGALQMIESGLLDRHQPLCCAGLHVWSELPTGVVAATDGPLMASVDRFEITLRGKGGHAGVPQTARDPVVAAGQLIGALQTVVSRTVDPNHPAVLTVGRVTAGHAFNVIPDHAALEGTVRAFHESDRDLVEAAIGRVAAGVAAACGVSAEVRYDRLSRPTVNDPRWAAELRACVPDVPGTTLAAPDYRVMAGEDMAYFLDACPGVFFLLGCGNDAVGASFPHHHPRFELDEAALPLGVSLLCAFAHRVLAH